MPEQKYIDIMNDETRPMQERCAAGDRIRGLAVMEAMANSHLLSTSKVLFEDEYPSWRNDLEY